MGRIYFFQIPDRPQAKRILPDPKLPELGEKWLDLRPFLDQQPYTVQADASASRAYRLLRTMGARNIYVVQNKPAIVGVLTRKVSEGSIEFSRYAPSSQHIKSLR